MHIDKISKLNHCFIFLVYNLQSIIFPQINLLYIRNYLPCCYIVVTVHCMALIVAHLLFAPTVRRCIFFHKEDGLIIVILLIADRCDSASLYAAINCLCCRWLMKMRMSKTLLLCVRVCVL